MKHSSRSVVGTSISSWFNRLGSIREPDPEITPENWCKIQPCLNINLASRSIILTQPTSSFFVYLLGILTIGAGLYFLQIRGKEISRLLWGISLIFWGLGALLAGTSYQAFGYHIKCAGRQFCSWTSWWEVTYLISQQLSMSFMLAAVAYSCADGSLHTVLIIYSVVSAAVYIVLVLIGAFVPIKSLITFELMAAFFTPIIVIFFGLNGWRYYMLQNPMDLALLGIWILLILTMVAYRIYDSRGFTQKLWAGGKGVWFSQNDVLHICLIFWIIYVVAVAADRIKDLTV